MTLGDNNGDVNATLFPDVRSIQERAEIGRVLARLGDPRPGAGVIAAVGLPDLVWSAEIPAGKYNIGDDLRLVSIDSPYRIARYPITNAQFQCFAEAGDRDHEAWWAEMPKDRQDFSEPRWSCVNYPRENVSWYQAMAFCRWLTSKLRSGQLPTGALTGDLKAYVITLPHEYEWEVAARWPNESVRELVYPWGSDFDADKANTSEGGLRQTTSVGIYPSGRNKALDLYDLSGNVWEWCRNKYGSPDDDKMDGSDNWRELRGGSWFNYQDHARAAARYDDLPDDRSINYGFRVVVVRRSPSHP
jgi:formylglycine-generating enzyme required for sulfatase activity